MSARMLLLLMKLMVPLLGLCAYLAFDFWNVNRMSQFGEGDGVTVGEYISGWVSLGSAVGASSAAAAPQMPTELAAMLPKPPEGWTMRPTEPSDIDIYLPADADEKLTHYVRAVVNPRGGNGTEEARQTYTNGPKTVVFELVRYPNFIFTSFGAAQIKMELQMHTTQYRGRDFMTVRGMEFTEDLLPEEVGLRYFMGNVSAQVWVRALAPRSMTDEDMLEFFKTLHVPAISANVVEKVAGMGEVPVIVLASAMDGDQRAARDAERATEATIKEQKRAQRKAEREAEKAAYEAEQAAAAEAKRQADEDRANGIERDEDTGVKVRKGTGKDKGKAGAKTKAGFDDGNCVMENGRKICGSGGEGE